MNNHDTDMLQTLEMKIMYQDEAIDALNKTVGLQHLEIQHINKQIELLSEYLKTLKTQADSGIKPFEEDAVPPHY